MKNTKLLILLFLSQLSVILLCFIQFVPKGKNYFLVNLILGWIFVWIIAFTNNPGLIY